MNILISTGAIPYRYVRFGQGRSNDAWLDYLRCSGTESSILSCTHDGIGIHRLYCSRFDNVGVECAVGE